MSTPTVTSHAEWESALQALREKEKAATRARDALAAERRRLPMASVPSDYKFLGESGAVTLLDLFDGRQQLVVYHHMLRAADTAPCAGCSMVIDSLCHPAHLRARDTTLALVSRAPIAEIAAFRRRMGWELPWYETLDGFNADMGVGTSFALNVFLRVDEAVYRTYSTTGRGVETLGSPWSILDLTAYGRQERWEDSPPGRPRGEPYRWWRLHDEYRDDERVALTG